MVSRAFASTDIQDACSLHAQSPDGLEEFARLTGGTLPPVAASLVRRLFDAERTIRDLTTMGGHR